MICPSCNRTPAEGAAFCNHCGTRLEDLCPACAANNPPSSRFCRSCGRVLPTTSGPASSVGDVRRDASHYACPRCRNVNEPGTAYCYSCGLPFGDGPPQIRQNVAIGGCPAGFWIRFVAWIIDSIVLTGIYIGVLFLIILVVYVALPESSLAACLDEDSGLSTSCGSLYTIMGTMPYLLGYVVSALYYVIGVSVWSTTVGKRILGLYVLRPDGSRIGPGRALARWLAYIPSSLLLFIGYLMIAFLEDKRGLHDLICDTVVIKR